MLLQLVTKFGHLKVDSGEDMLKICDAKYYQIIIMIYHHQNTSQHLCHTVKVYRKLLKSERSISFQPENSNNRLTTRIMSIQETQVPSRQCCGDCKLNEMHVDSVRAATDRAVAHFEVCPGHLSLNAFPMLIMTQILMIITQEKDNRPKNKQIRFRLYQGAAQMLRHKCHHAASAGGHPFPSHITQPIKEAFPDS